MRKHNYLYYYFLVIVSVLFLCGCSKFQGSDSDRSEGAETTTQDYEKFEEEVLKTQTDFDKFTNDIFLENVQSSTLDLHYTLMNPSALEVPDFPVTYGDFSMDVMKSDLEYCRETRETLLSFEKDHLTGEQLLTYRTLLDYLDTELTSEGLELYYQPLAPTIGIQAQLPILLAEYQFYSKNDVDTYLELLKQIDEYYAQFSEFQKEKAAAGLAPSDSTLDHIIQSCSAYLVRPENNVLTQTFKERLDIMTELSAEEKDAYIAAHDVIIKEHFIPAYNLLVDELTKLKGSGTNEYGLSYYENGREYYEYLVAGATGTTYTVPELKEAITVQRDKDLEQISTLLRSNPSIMNELDNYSFSLSDPNEILEDLKLQISKDFPELPDCNYTIKYVPESLENTLSPAFYLTPPLDLYTENTIYINQGEEYINDELYTILAHEGYPGHLYQHVYFLSNNHDNLRHTLSCSGYSEGWATYVEMYSYTLDNGLGKDLGKILASNQSASLALYALLDINIHYEGWTIEDAKQFLYDYYFIDDDEVVRDVYYAVLESPANYLEYYTGYLEILNMRNEAEEVLKNDFNLKDFHKFILDIGNNSFRVIRPYFKVWLMSHSGMMN